MANSVVKLTIDSAEYDAKLKSAGDALNKYFDIAKKGDRTFEQLDDGVMDAVKAMGRMETTSKSARGQLSELKKSFTDLSLIYKRFTDQEKASPVGKEMAKSLQELKTRISDTKKDLSDISKELNGDSTAKGGGLNTLLSVFGGNVLTKATGTLTSEITNIVKRSTELATQADGIQIAFRRLGSGDILDGLRRATHNTVSDLELMKAAVKFNDFKLPLEQLGTMLAFAQKKAKDTGQSVDYMVDSIVTGLGRKSLQILDNLGISASEVRDKMKETGDMTKAVGEIIREQMEKAGDYVETASDRAAKANVELENQMLKLGETMRDVFGFDGWDQMANSIKATLASVLADVIGQLGTIKGILGGLTVGQAKTSRYGTSGVPAEVERDLQALQNASGADRDAMYSRMLAKYEKRYNAASASLAKAQGGYDFNENSSNWQGVPFVRKALDRHYWSTRVNTARSNAQAEAEVLAAFRSGAAGIFNPSVATPAIASSSGKGGGSSATTVAKELNPMQQAQKEISALTEEALTADEARRKVIREEIADLQKQVEEYKKIQDYVTGNGAAAQGSLPQLTQQLKDLQQAQSQSLDTREWVEYQKQIDVTNTKIDILKGKWKEGQVATFSIDVGNTEALDLLKNLEGVDIGEETITVTADTAEAYNKVQELISGIEGTTVSFEVTPQVKPLPTLDDYRIQAMIEIDAQNTKVDTNTLQTLLQDAIQQGIDITSLNLEPIAEQIGKGIDVPDSAWEGIMDGYKELCEEIGADPIKIDLKTGNKAGSEVKDMKADWKDAASAVQSLGSALQSIEDPAAKVVGIIAQAIATVALTFSKSLAGTVTPWDWIAAAAAGTATMISTIAAIKSATSGGFAEGGIVPGNSYSGDNLRLSDYGVNSGELILNRAQQDSIASQLQQSEGGGMTSAPFVTADKIVLGVNNWGRATGRGQLVFAKN